jgi:hypothetical protein
MFKATVVGTTLVIEIPLESPRPSSSGKTLIVASTGGFKQTEAKVNGQLVAVSTIAPATPAQQKTFDDIWQATTCEWWRLH